MDKDLTPVYYWMISLNTYYLLKSYKKSKKILDCLQHAYSNLTPDQCADALRQTLNHWESGLPFTSLELKVD